MYFLIIYASASFSILKYLDVLEICLHCAHYVNHIVSYCIVSFYHKEVLCLT